VKKAFLLGQQGYVAIETQAEVEAMGLFTHLLSFGAGYATGTKVGGRPAAATRSLLDKGTSTLSSATTRVGADVRARFQGAREPGSSTAAAPESISGTTVDIRDVREVMSASPETVTATTPIKQAASLLETADIGSVIVVGTDGQVQGIITDRDIALRVVAAGRDAQKTTAQDVMTPAPATIEPTASVQEAVALMRQHDVRRLPIVESGRAIGVVALGDLATSSEAKALLADISSAPPNN
jgi:CBS domain-containing protein